MRLLSLVFTLLLSVTFLAAERPNILVVMVDDLGYSDIGCYGGEIDTPNLDRLAQNGLRFSQFYNTAKCHSSRISLLTGRYAYQAGNTDLSKAVTSAEVLGKAGYFTAMTGKWHLKEQPTDFGFQRYWGHLSGACNYYKGDNTFRLKTPTSAAAPLKSKFLSVIALSDMSGDQRAEVRKVLVDLLAPFRRVDREESMRLIEPQFDKLHMAFYKDQDVGSDGMWDVWQLEGPNMIWYFRGDPHVHAWVNIRKA